MTADQVRAAMPDDMRKVCDSLKAAFGAKLLYIETDTLTAGDKRMAFDDLDGGSEVAKLRCEAMSR